MRFTPKAISDVVLIKPQVFGDNRGFFMETWRQSTFAEAGIQERFVQDNHTKSAANVLRGLHYQIKHPQGKLVRVAAGEVFDVAVDLRRGSSTFGNWVGETLSESNKNILWVPPGFAHGFYVLSREAELLYKCTDYYWPEHERTIRWDDPELAIEWPIPETGSPVVSDKDSRGRWFKEAEYYP